MKATELRIGNYVDILSNKKRHNERHLLIETIDSFEVNTDFRGYEVADLIPIPPTEEILLKCGFKKCNLLFINDIIPFVKIVKCGDYFDVIIGNVFYVKLYSLHQLQNLYFALTGQELEINL